MYHPRNESILARIRDLEAVVQMQKTRLDAHEQRHAQLQARIDAINAPRQAPYQPRPLSEPVSGKIPPQQPAPKPLDYYDYLEEKMRNATNHAKQAVNDVQGIAKTAVERINQSWKDAK